MTISDFSGFDPNILEKSSSTTNFPTVCGISGYGAFYIYNGQNSKKL